MGVLDGVLRALGLGGDEGTDGSGTDDGSDTTRRTPEASEHDNSASGDEHDTSDASGGWADRSGATAADLREDLTADELGMRWGATAALVERLRSGEADADDLVADLLDDAERTDAEPPMVVLGTIAEAEPSAVEPYADRLVALLREGEERQREHATAALTQMPSRFVPTEPLLEEVLADGPATAEAGSVLGRAVGSGTFRSFERLREHDLPAESEGARATAYLRLLAHAVGLDPGTDPEADFAVVSERDWSEPEEGDEGGTARGVDMFVASEFDRDTIEKFLDEETDANCVEFEVAETPMGRQMVVVCDPVPDDLRAFAERVGDRFHAQVDVQEP